MIYLDNAATSWPKPPTVRDAVITILEQSGGNPGRSGHRLSVEAGRVVFEARELTAKLFNADDSLRVIFTLNATHALNFALKGLLKPGDSVVTTGMEHNSVMRPLRALERNGVKLSAAECSKDGALDIGKLAELVKPGVKLVAVNHASNVCGTIQDISAIARIAHDSGALLMVDAAQTAGTVPIDMQEMGIDLLAFSGHKGLMGPTGTGGLIIGKQINSACIEPLILGGTGSRSGQEEQPEYLPDKFESGTPNSVGIAGLSAGIQFVLSNGVDSIREHEVELTQLLIDGLAAIDGVTVYGTQNAKISTAVVSFTIEGQQVSEVGLKLEDEYGIMARVGLHCAPAAHKTLGTYPEGTIRFAPGFFTTQDEIKQAISAIKSIVKR